MHLIYFLIWLFDAILEKGGVWGLLGILVVLCVLGAN